MLRDGFDSSKGILRPGKWSGDLNEFHELFVTSAPNPGRREKLFNALELWLESVHKVLPLTMIWVNGGFVTHKMQVPEDIDVVAFSRVGNFTNSVNSALIPLITDTSTIPKKKPIAYGGKIDTFVVPHTNELIMNWMVQWGRLMDPSTRTVVPNSEKGFVELTYDSQG